MSLFHMRSVSGDWILEKSLRHRIKAIYTTAKFLNQLEHVMKYFKWNTFFGKVSE